MVTQEVVIEKTAEKGQGRGGLRKDQPKILGATTKGRARRATERENKDHGRDSGTTQAEPFLAELEKRRVSSHTVRAYRADMRQLLAWLRHRGMTAADLNRSVCRQYASDLAASSASPSTIARKVTSMRSFVGFLAESGIMAGDAADDIRTPKRKRSLPSVVSQGEADAIIEAAAKAMIEAMPSGFTGDFRADFPADFRPENRAEICQRIRDLAVLELLYGCGLRNAELCGLLLLDVRRESGMLVVRGKGGKTRMVPYAAATLVAVDRWLAIRPESRTQHLLLTVNKNPLDTGDVRRIVARAGRRVGLDVHPHGLRHACATHLMEKGADIRMIQEFLGHASITTTQVYTRVTETQLRSVYLRSHPRARENT